MQPIRVIVARSVAVVAILGLAQLGTGQEPRSQSDFAAMGTAKVLASAVFV